MSAAAARAANVATHDVSNDKEARGLQLISRALEKDGRLNFHKSFEGARADFCVYRPGAPALGIQLKTTCGSQVTPSGRAYHAFQSTNGYAGLLIIFVALHVHPPRIWLANGSEVISTCVQIPVKLQQRTMKSDRFREVDFATVADAIHALYVAALSGSNSYVLRSPMDHEKPISRNGLAEYTAFKRLQRSLPVPLIAPPVEHMSYDYLVDGKRWQLKLAGYSKYDRYHVVCHRHGGRVGGKTTYRQYQVDDFDFLCIQLPENTVDCCYVIPQGVLAKHGIIGNSIKSGGHVRVYPHRRMTTTKLVHTVGVHWTEAYRIDFANNPLAKLAGIVGG